MKRLFTWLLRLSVLLFVAGGAFFVHVWYFKPAKVEWFYARTFAKFAFESPELLSNLRILPGWLDFYSDELDDASPAHEQRQVDLVRSELETLRGYDRSKMSPDGQLSYDVLEYFLASQVEGDAFRNHDFPINQLSGIQSALPNFMAQVHQVTGASEAKDYLARLNAFPIKFAQVLEGLRLRESKGVIPPQFTVEEVIAQMQGFVGVSAEHNVLYTNFKEKLDAIPSATLDAAAKQQLLTQAEESIRQRVYPAYRQLIDYFVALKPKAQGNFGAWHLPDGDAYYAWCVRRHTTTTMTPEEVHQLGLAEVARVGAEMNDILAAHGLVDGTVGARVQQLAQAPEQRYPDTPEGKAAMLEQYQAILNEVNAGLGGAFDVRPRLGVEVKAVPAFAEKTAPGAYYEPGAFDGSRPGVFYANMRNMGETPKFAMRTLAYHEGIPGHHFQIAIAQELKDVPFFRRVLPFTAYIEGWALYAERLTWELGFEKDPLDNLGRLRDEMMRAVRLVVDSGIHYKRWTREQAIAYMLDHTGMAETDVVAEIERYFVDPGQALAYKAGMLKILALREKAKAQLGPKFDLKQFHNEILTHGALPLALLERVVDAWVVIREKSP